MSLDELYQIIENRKKEMPNNSYIASLFREGKDRIIQKVGEEATELIIAGKNNKKREIISEAADLLFHTLIFLSLMNISPKVILKELQNRRKQKKFMNQ